MYAVTFVWGRLLDARQPFPLLDWSGQLSVSLPGSAVKVLRPIDFEDGEDQLLPVLDPATAAWEVENRGRLRRPGPAHPDS